MVSEGFQTQKRVRGSREKNEQKGSWRVRSRSMKGRSGRVKSARNQMCGRGGAAGVATMTSERGRVGSTGRRLQQGVENGLRALRRQAGRKTGSPKVWTQNMRSFGPGLRPWRPRRARTSIQEGNRHGGREVNGDGLRG